MKVLFLGAYDDSEIVVAPIKVGKELFNNISCKGIHSFYLSYFDDGNKYNRIQKLFGFEKIRNKIYRSGIFPILFFTIKFKPDIIQIVTPEAFYLLLFLLKKVIGFKAAYLTHSIISYSLKHYLKISYYKKLRFFLIEKIVYEYSDLVLMLSNVEARFARRYLKVSADKLKIVDNGINLYNIFKRFETDNSNEIKIISVGYYNRKEKGFRFLMQSLSKIPLPVSLTICSYKNQVITDEIPINIKIILKSELTEGELRQEICNNDIFVTASEYEPFSLALLEAMNTGVLFVITDKVRLAERFPREFQRFIVPAYSTEIFGLKVLEIFYLEFKEKLIISEKIKNFTLNYTWDKVAHEYLINYEKMLNH